MYEVTIKAAKKAICGILGNVDVFDEELMTAFTGAEAWINSRPLTYQSTNPADDVSLTPNHFLIGQVGGNFAAQIEDETDYKTMETSSGTGATLLEFMAERMSTRFECTTEVVSPTKRFSSR